MEVDASVLMYETFQACRYVHPDVGVSVRALREVLDVVRSSGSFWLDEATPCVVNGPWARDLPDHGRWLAPAGSGPPPALERRLTADNQALFYVIDRATDDLVRLCAAGARTALGDLGYGLHPLPSLLATPRAFNRGQFAFNFRYIAFHWSALSEPLKDALCRLLSLDRADADALVQAKGFTSSMQRG